MTAWPLCQLGFCRKASTLVSSKNEVFNTEAYTTAERLGSEGQEVTSNCFLTHHTGGSQELAWNWKSLGISRTLECGTDRGFSKNVAGALSNSHK